MPERRGDALTTTRLLFVARGLGPAVAPPTNGPTPDRRPQIPGAETWPSPTRQILSVGWSRRRRASRFSLCDFFLVLIPASLLGICKSRSVSGGHLFASLSRIPHLYYCRRRDVISTDMRPDPDRITRGRSFHLFRRESGTARPVTSVRDRVFSRI